MSYIALYRRWRPTDFENLVGQDHISRTLANAISMGKVAHAYLFSGPRGTGKTSTAKIFAKALNCEHGPTPKPCNVCDPCTKINSGASMDVFEIDAASNRGIDEIRDLRETVKFAPVDGRYKVYIIDEVHMLTTEAFNALLKTLEEPPAHVVFILATTEAQKVPATIHSRCQRYDFRRISIDEIVSRLSYIIQQMQIAAEPEALQLIAAHADGGLRDALSILDQCSTDENEAVTVERVRGLLGLIGHEAIWGLAEALANKDTKEILGVLDRLISLGKEPGQILSEVSLHLRGVMVYQATKEANELRLYSSNEDVLKKHSEMLSYEDLSQMIQTMHTAANEMKWSPQPRITAEVAFLSLCYLPDERQAAGEDRLLLRIEALEKKLAKMTGGDWGSSSRPMIVSEKITPAKRPATEEKPSKPVLQKQNEKKLELKQETTQPSVEIGDKEAVWQRLLKGLMSRGKAAVHACVSQGRLQSFAGDRFVIAFTAKFPKERTDKPDYRVILDEVLSEIVNRDVKVQCVLAEDIPQPEPKQIVHKSAKAGDTLTSEQRHVLDTAVEVFGDDLHQEE